MRLMNMQNIKIIKYCRGAESNFFFFFFLLSPFTPLLPKSQNNLA